MAPLAPLVAGALDMGHFPSSNEVSLTETADSAEQC